jgi:hypothetical protein
MARDRNNCIFSLLGLAVLALAMFGACCLVMSGMKSYREGVEKESRSSYILYMKRTGNPSRMTYEDYRAKYQEESR